MEHLYTEAGRKLSGIPHEEYPRPMLRRTEWMTLNGEWDFAFREKGEDSRLFSARIAVPFCPESLLSGITADHKKNTVLTYRRFFSVPESWTGKRILLHFGAVDQACTVIINNELAGGHRGGYLPFSMDITKLLRAGENEIVVNAVDDLSHRYPWGKQKKRRGGMWYTPVSGIWQSVWLEPVPDKAFTKIECSCSLTAAELRFPGISSGSVLCEGKEYPITDGKCRITPETPRLWTPETPCLYPFTATAGEDRVESYFALRTLEIKKVDGIARLCLNGEPYFFHGLLDQGYWSDGLYTPPALSCYAQDILAMKALGFNTLRKHIKIEPEQFYYDCDRLGMVVFQDMVNNGSYSFLRDTALPTAGITKLNDRLLHRNKQTRTQFLQAMEETVTLLGNHPCICLWTVFNEGWGQFNGTDAYRKLKALDPSRFVDTASGWFSGCESDVESLHIYFRPLKAAAGEKPVLLSEFGGYSYKLPAHSANKEKTYGYGKYEDRDAFRQAFLSLYREQLLPLAKNCICGSVYTQVSDVEDETNGLLTYDRAVCKLKPEEFEALSEELKHSVLPER